MKKGIIMSGFALTCLLSLTSCHKDEKPTNTIAPPVRVRVVVVGDNPESSMTGSSYSGTVSAQTVTLVSFSATGTITSLPLSEGQQVSKGQVIGRLSGGDYENANNIAQAQLAEARDAYERMKKLHDANALPDIKWIEMEQKLKQAENAADIAKRALNDAVLTAPVSGTINKKLASVGQNVIMGQPVYEIISTGDLTIDISVPENEIDNFKKGQKARISFENNSIGECEGLITNKSIVADPLTRGFKVKVSLPASGGKILPGMIGNVVFDRDVNASDSIMQILLPAQAVQLAADNSNFVWIVKDGKAERRNVSANRLASSGVIINSGLNRGDSVITEGVRKVGTGTKITPVL